MTGTETQMKKEDNKGALDLTLKYLSITGGILSLSSLSKGLLDFKGFILQVIEFYQSIFHTIFKYVFIWVPFEIPTGIYDYFILGCIFTISYIRGFSKFEPELKINFMIGLSRREFYRFANLKSTLSEILSLCFLIAIWPLTFFFTLIDSLQFKGARNDNQEGLELVASYYNELVGRTIFKLLASILLGVILLYIINLSI